MDQGPRAAEPRPWWQDADRRNRFAVVVLAALMLSSMLFVAFTILLRGDTRVMVVTMEPNVGQANRDGLRAACGDLPGITPVKDRGNPDPNVQGRFPVRFDIAGTTIVQEAALVECLNANQARYGIRGFLPE